MRREFSLLVVDDDPSIRRTFSDLVGSRPGLRVGTVASGKEALEWVERDPVDVAVVDLHMPAMGGMELLERLRRARPEIEVVMLTAFGSIESAVQAVKLGAADYLTKPFKLAQFFVILERLQKFQRLEEENRRLREELSERYRVSGLVGSGPGMQKVHRLVDRVRRETCPVLLCGESGTGKELVARAIHYDGNRRSGPFVTVDCASVSHSLLESELFGHVKGAFTGADESRVGLFERAQGGTLFLDEVGELPLSLQPSLLRSLSERRVRPVGATEDISVDVRILAATNRDLEEEIRTGRFREDLYYRLNVVRIEIPPLRRRKEDLPDLVDHFLRRIGTSKISREALYRLLRHDWPGNVRELENALAHACALAPGRELGPDDLPPLEKEPVPSGNGRSLRDLELEEIRRLLTLHHGSTGAVAGILGIDRSTLYRKIRRYRIDLTKCRSNGTS